MAQNLIVVLLVVCCFVYVVWTLVPKAPRSRLAVALLKLPLPTFLHKPLTAATKQQGGCGCDGCDRSPMAKKPVVPGVPVKPGGDGFQPLTFVRGNYAKKAPR